MLSFNKRTMEKEKERENIKHIFQVAVVVMLGVVTFADTEAKQLEPLEIKYSPQHPVHL